MSEPGSGSATETSPGPTPRSAGPGRIRVLALDLDGTAKMVGEPFSPALAERISRLRAKGVKVILATGRSLAELAELVDFEMFDAIAAENGTVLVMNGKKTVLAPPGWFQTREELAGALGKGPEEVLVSLDRGMLERAQRAVAGRARIELNKDRIMIAPEGFDKGTGLLRVLKEMGIRGGVACAGDGENDLTMFRISNYRIALENSVDALKGEADFVAAYPDGEGVVEAIDELLRVDANLR